MKNRLLTLAGALALLAVLGKFYAKPVLAQVRAALVTSIDEPARSPYQMVLDSGCSTFSCDFSTNAIPANKRLHVTHISTWWYGNHVVYFYTDRQTLFHATPLTTTFVALTNQYVVDRPLDSYVDGGDRIHVTFTGSTPPAVNLAVTVTGYLIDCAAAACAPTVAQ
jgi:hypothetical protein